MWEGGGSGGGRSDILSCSEVLSTVVVSLASTKDARVAFGVILRFLLLCLDPYTALSLQARTSLIFVQYRGKRAQIFEASPLKLFRVSLR